MKPYLIVMPARVHTSAGICALHDFRSHLVGFGCKVETIVLPGGQDPITLRSMITSIDEFSGHIVIYPDCYTGNMLGAKNVVRLVFMYPGYFGQDADYPESEYLYYYSPNFILNGRNPDNILSVPCVDMTPTDLPADAIRITNAMNLPELFRNVKKLVTFDDSAINMEAEFFGLEVEYRFNEKFEKPIQFGPRHPNAHKDYWAYLVMKKEYYERQLPDFIQRTQERFK